VVSSNGGYAHILLKNSVFGQLSAFHRNIVPRARHFENVVYLKPIHKTPVLNRGSIFPAGEFFNRIRRKRILQSWSLRRARAILRTAGSKSVRIANAFKSQKNWRALIRSDRRGAYRLNVD
jgi:hypothetical protein